MTNDKHQKNSSGVGAALVGAAVGAAAGAAAVALTSERNRKLIKAEFKKAVKGSSKTMEGLKKEATDFSQKASAAVTKKVEELEQEVAKRLKEVKAPEKK